MKSKRKPFPTKSPYLDGALPKTPTDALHALAILDDCENVVAGDRKRLEALTGEAIDIYDLACRAYLDRSFDALEDAKRSYAENERRRLKLIDEIAFEYEQIRVAKAYLSEHPIKTTDKGEICDDGGRVAKPSPDSEVQARQMRQGTIWGF